MTSAPGWHPCPTCGAHHPAPPGWEAAPARDPLTITFPWPPKGIQPNRRYRNIGALAAVRGQYREDCWLHAKQSRHRFTVPVRATVRFVCPDPGRRRDVDNLHASLKPLWDGCVATGLLVDDSARWLSVQTAEPPFAKGHWGVEVTFEERAE